ncbi:MAG TPA: potassium channel family protein [Candidatus Aquilonibacter sp.]|nr:potassium channel family protein [Candidatus Aquilonibacter sp.]
MFERIALTVIGIVLVVLALNDVFQSVIVPRAVGRGFRVSYLIWRGGWRFWPPLSFRLHASNQEAREDFLAVFAPIALIAQLILWSLLLVTGYGLIFWADANAIRPPMHSFFQALYLAGASYFTIGFGDFVGGSGWTRMWTIIAGASGFGVVGTTTAFLFAVFASFQTREQFVVTVGARAGMPPSGVALLAIASHARIIDGLPGLMRDAQAWCAQLMETHLAYPVLAYFRSSHDYESWVGTLGTLLDAATLMMTTVQSDSGEARIFYEIGRHATRDLSRYFGYAAADEHDLVGITREEFDHACDRLAHAGYTLHERERAWKNFSLLRRAYAAPLNWLAHRFSIPPLQWIGDRSEVRSNH